MCLDVRAGMDMALAFVARQNGEEAAQQVAGFLEYSGDFRWPSTCESAICREWCPHACELGVYVH